MSEMEARIVDNRLVLPIGTAITFKMIAKNKQKIDLNLVESGDKFFALFDENDVDFEIEINNLKCIHGIGYTLIVNNGFYDYYVGAGQRWSMEALYTRGRKLHFISEKSEEGQNVIRKTAEDYDMSYSESAAVCSRIEFNFEVEKAKKKPEKPIDTLVLDELESDDTESRGLGANYSFSDCGLFGGASSNQEYDFEAEKSAKISTKWMDEEDDEDVCDSFETDDYSYMRIKRSNSNVGARPGGSAPGNAANKEMLKLRNLPNANWYFAS